VHDWNVGNVLAIVVCLVTLINFWLARFKDRDEKACETRWAELRDWRKTVDHHVGITNTNFARLQAGCAKDCGVSLKVDD
jgi:hypothetical protein